MDTDTNITPLTAVTDGDKREMAAMERVGELARQISHALNDLPRPLRVTIEPSASAVYPVLMEDLNPDLLPDHLAMMTRGLAVMERGAKMKDPRILGLGLLWGVDDGRFGGVAVRYAKAGA